MQEYMDVRKAAIYAAFQHGDIDDEEATRELLAVEQAARQEYADQHSRADSVASEEDPP